MSDEFARAERKVFESFKDRKRKEEELWKGYDLEVNKLTGLVEARFREVADRILAPQNIQLGDVHVVYNAGAVSKGSIKRISIGLSGGIVHREGRDFEIGRDTCAYLAYRGIATEYALEVTSFMNDFMVRHIGVHSCECGSDHK